MKPVVQHKPRVLHSMLPQRRALFLAFAIGAGMLALAQSAHPPAPPSVRLLWRTPLRPSVEAPAGLPAVSGGRLFVVTNRVEAYSTDKGALLWHAPLSAFLPRGLVATHDKVFVCEAVVSALDVRTGRKVWEFTPEEDASQGVPATDGRVLYFGTIAHRIHALQTINGKEIWSTDVMPEVRFHGIVRGVAIDHGTLFAAIEQWRSENGEVSSGWLAALNAQTGRILWRYETGSGLQRRSFGTPVAAGHLVLANDPLGNSIVALDRESGEQVWQFDGEPGTSGFQDAPIVDNKTVYAGSGDASFYAIELATGHLVWQTKMRGSIDAYVLCGRSILASYEGMAALALDSGRIIRRFFNDESEYPTSSFAVDNGRAFTLGPDGVYAFTCR